MIRLLIAIVLLVSVPVEAQVQRYDIDKVRETLLKIRDGLPPQALVVQGDPASPEALKFIRFYADVIHPKLQALKRLSQRRSAIKLLLDTGSYVSEKEQKQFKSEYAQITAELSGIQVDPVFNGEIETWAQLSDGLTGELPAYARAFAKENEFEHFAEDQKPTLIKAELLHQKYADAIRSAVAAAGLAEWKKKSAEIPRLFKSGVLTIKEAQEQSSEMNQRVGLRYVGAEAVQAQGQSLNEMAILRTELAQSKGYRTWAEYQLEASGQGYLPEYRGVANQREFLHKWIRQMRPPVELFIDRRVRDLGIDKSKLRRNHVGLLTLPDLNTAQRFFPADNLVNIFDASMIESGFKSSDLGQMIVDEKPREGLKNPTMAYMSPTFIPEDEIRTLDASTLSFVPGQAKMPGTVYIMQNFRVGGLDELRTMYHEGMGHALEYLLKDKEDMTSEGYGYVEVPSMTAEYFLREPQFLFDNATTFEGEKPSLEQFRTWILNSDRNTGVDLLMRASSALYDIDLWDYDYKAKGAKTYLERAEQIFNANEVLTGLPPFVESHVPAFYAYLATTHFTSGSVRNIGYSYATLGSEMMSKWISKELERRTGRASWYKQPGLAELISEAWYKVGWKTRFPQNIEAITGEKFDVEKILAEMTKNLNCESILNCPPEPTPAPAPGKVK